MAAMLGGSPRIATTNVLCGTEAAAVLAALGCGVGPAGPQAARSAVVNRNRAGTKTSFFMSSPEAGCADHSGVGPRFLRREAAWPGAIWTIGRHQGRIPISLSPIIL